MAYIFIEDHVKFMAYKLKERAAAGCNQLQHIRIQQNKPPIRSWRRMRQLLQSKFLHPNYHQILFQQFESCSQENRTVITYTDEFY